jgi:hypothetical protein
LPFNAAMAFSASASSLISAKPNPRGCPVKRSRSRVRESGCMPASENSACTSSSVALNDRLPTYSFFTLVLLAPPMQAGANCEAEEAGSRPAGDHQRGRPPRLKRAPQQQEHSAATAPRSQPLQAGAGLRAAAVAFFTKKRADGTPFGFAQDEPALRNQTRMGCAQPSMCAGHSMLWPYEENSARPRIRLGAVAGIDVDVFDGEVAGPDAGGGVA